MASRGYMSGSLNTAVITVGVEPGIADQLMHAAEKKPWSVNLSSFAAYISAARRPSFGPQVSAVDACVAMVDFDGNSDQAVETVKYLTQMFGSKVSIIAISKSQDPQLLLTAMRAGCSEFLQKPIKEAPLGEVLTRLESHWSTSLRPAAAAGSIISFFGAKGGVGTTTAAVHLSMFLVQCHQKRVLLIDSRPELGHVCVYLGLDGSRFHFAEVVRNVSRLDSELLHGYVARHSSGLEVLSSPDVCAGIKNSDPEAMTKTLDFLRSEYDYVIVDGAMSFDDTTLRVIEASARVYLVATPEVGAIRDLSRCVDKMVQVEDSPDKLHVVLNRYSSPYSISVEQIERAMKLPVAIKLPNSYPELVRAENLGEPIAPTSKSDLSQQIGKWADTLVGTSRRMEAPVKKEKGLFGMFKKADAV